MKKVRPRVKFNPKSNTVILTALCHTLNVNKSIEYLQDIIVILSPYTQSPDIYGARGILLIVFIVGYIQDMLQLKSQVLDDSTTVLA